MRVYLVDRDLPGITGKGLAMLQRAELSASQQLTGILQHGFPRRWRWVQGWRTAEVVMIKEKYMRSNTFSFLAPRSLVIAQVVALSCALTALAHAAPQSSPAAAAASVGSPSRQQFQERLEAARFRAHENAAALSAAPPMKRQRRHYRAPSPVSMGFRFSLSSNVWKSRARRPGEPVVRV